MGYAALTGTISVVQCFGCKVFCGLIGSWYYRRHCYCEECKKKLEASDSNFKSGVVQLGNKNQLTVRYVGDEVEVEER